MRQRHPFLSFAGIGTFIALLVLVLAGCGGGTTSAPTSSGPVTLTY